MRDAKKWRAYGFRLGRMVMSKKSRECPVCKGIVTPVPYSREDPDVVLERHILLAHGGKK